jgi:hypothetical protein
LSFPAQLENCQSRAAKSSLKTIVDVTSLSQLVIMGDDLNRAKLLLGRQLAELQKTANDGFRLKS